MKTLLAITLSVILVPCASAQTTLTADKMLVEIGSTLVPAVLDSAKGGAAQEKAYFTKDGRFLLVMLGPQDNLASFSVIQYDKLNIDPQFVDFMARILGNAFGANSDPQLWIMKEGKLGRPTERYFRETDYKDARIRLYYNVDRVPFQLYVELGLGKR
jgi:hypothetical protein